MEATKMMDMNDSQWLKWLLELFRERSLSGWWWWLSWHLSSFPEISFLFWNNCLNEYVTRLLEAIFIICSALMLKSACRNFNSDLLTGDVRDVEQTAHNAEKTKALHREGWQVQFSRECYKKTVVLRCIKFGFTVWIYPLMCIHGKSEAGSTAGRTSHSTEQRLMTTHSAQIQSDTVRKGGAGVEGGLKTKAAKIATPINWVCRRVSVGWRWDDMDNLMVWLN